MDKHAIFPPGSLPGAPSCHCSSLVVLPDGDLFAAWFAGTAEKAPDVAIWGARWRAGAGWETPRVIANTPAHSEGNPVLYLTPGPVPALVLFYQTMHHGRVIPPGWSVCTIKYQVSRGPVAELGTRWEPWQFLRRMWFWVIRGKPLRLRSGRVLLPVHRELGTYQAMFYITEDPHLGGRWKRRGRLKAPGGCLEPAIQEVAPGKILCALRTARAKRVYCAWSTDDGISWSRPAPTVVPNPNSQVDLLAVPGGPVLMACNPVEAGRGQLALVPSFDEGRTWALDRKVVVEEAGGAGGAGGAEFSYPCLVPHPDGPLHLSYTHKRRTINHLIFSPEEVLS